MIQVCNQIIRQSSGFSFFELMPTGSGHHLAANLLISSCTAVAIAIVWDVSNELLP
ncbi:hypothetical protein KBT16_18970 [Nostoc sp. CCCryo 231-06]|nr:hypothetical protein [Nostoc sp. CCCryo 231-06]